MPRNAAMSSNPIDTEDPARNLQCSSVTPTQSLIEELEGAIGKQDLRHRATVMRRVTDLFIMNGAGFSEEHIAIFDDVMSRLVVAIDKSARAEFGELFARHPNPPLRTSRILALDDEIAVAGPILSRSQSLMEETLIEGAKTKSQDHLLAISLRESIGAAVTDILVERGDSKVLISTAANPGAKFSEFGCSTLATRSKNDAELAFQVWSRSDIPRQHLLTLFAAASEEVQRQLESADRQKVQLYRYVAAQAKNQIQTQIRESSATYIMARPYIESLYGSGELTEERLLAFAEEGKFDEVTVALALMSDLPVGHIERAIVHAQTDHLLVLAKAIGLSWETTKAILMLRPPGKNNIGREIEAHCANFAKLQAKTAISAMQFYRLRAKAEAQLEAN
jgi:uncharacterized protein (DUF2336 family)